MNRFSVRIAGLVAGIAIAATVAVPVLASSAESHAAVTALAGQGTVDAAATDTAAMDPTANAGIGRCAAAWLAARANPTVGNLKVVGDCEVDRRLDAITRLHGLVDEAGVMTASHKATLDGILDADRSGLTALRGQIDGDTTIATLRTDIRKIFTDYRVYVLVARQVLLVRGDDRVAAAVARLTAGEGTLEAAIARAQANGKDVTAAQADLAAMTADVTSASSAVAGDADAVLAQTPAAWNAGTSKPILDAARASISSAVADLKAAVSEARATLAALR